MKNKLGAGLFKGFSRLLAFAVSAVCFGGAFCTSVFAADTYSNIKTPDTVVVGDEFSVVLTFGADESIGSVKASIDYDSDVIEFVSGDFANGGGGLCTINGWSDTSGRVQSYTLTFKAIAKGSSQLAITKSTVYSDDGDLLGRPVSLCTVYVVTAGEITVTTTATESPAETTLSAPDEPDVSDTVTTAPTGTTPAQSEQSPSQTTAWQGGNSGGDDVSADNSGSEDVAGGNGSEDSQTTDGNLSVSDKDSSKLASDEDKDMKGTVTTILIVGGMVVIVCILLSGDSKGSGKKRSSSKRRSSSSSKGRKRR